MGTKTVGSMVASSHEFEYFWSGFTGKEIGCDPSFVFDNYAKLKGYVDSVKKVKECEENLNKLNEEIKEVTEKIDRNIEDFNKGVVRQKELLEEKEKLAQNISIEKFDMKEIEKIEEEFKKILENEPNNLKEKYELLKQKEKLDSMLSKELSNMSELKEAVTKSKQNLETQKSEKENFENSFPRIVQKIKHLKNCDISEAEKIVKEAFKEYRKDENANYREMQGIDEKDFSILANIIQEAIKFNDRCYDAIQSIEGKQFSKIEQEQKNYDSTHELIDSVYSNTNMLYHFDAYSKRNSSMKGGDYEKDSENIRKSFECMNSILDGTISSDEKEKVIESLENVQKTLSGSYDIGAIAKLTGKASYRTEALRYRHNIYTDIPSQLKELSSLEKSKDEMGLSGLVFQDEEIMKQNTLNENDKNKEHEKENIENDYQI